MRFHAVAMIFIAGLLIASPARADISFGLESGYRVDELEWTIAGTPAGTDPNILSELDWDDVEIFLLAASVEYVGTRRRPTQSFFPFFRIEGGGGWILDGTVRDSDYLGDNRTFEFSRSISDTEDGHVLDAAAQLGIQIRPPREAGLIWKLTPFVGYNYARQSFKLHNGFQIIDTMGGFFGPFPGLDSEYETNWNAATAGLHADLARQDSQGRERWMLRATLSLHRLWYDAEADWNLRADLAHPVSFEHQAEGDGLSARLQGSYSPAPHHRLGLSGEYRDWSADEDGVDRVFFADGTEGVTRFNGVDWRSWSVTAFWGMAF